MYVKVVVGNEGLRADPGVATGSMCVEITKLDPVTLDVRLGDPFSSGVLVRTWILDDVFVRVKVMADGVGVLYAFSRGQRVGCTVV